MSEPPEKRDSAPTTAAAPGEGEPRDDRSEEGDRSSDAGGPASAVGGEASDAEPADGGAADCPSPSEDGVHSVAARRRSRWALLAAVVGGLAVVGVVVGVHLSREAARARAEAELAAGCERGEVRACSVLCERTPPVLSACLRVGDALSNGPTEQRDEPRSVRIFERACGSGENEACARLGRALYNGSGTKRDPAAALGRFRASCDAGSQLGCAGLGHMLMFGHGGAQRDVPKAIELFQRSCDAGELRGCASLAVAFLNGTGIERDRERAFALFTRVCDQKIGRGCLGKALMLLNGLGVARDDVAATRLLETTCAGDTKDACAELGQAYLLGRGVKADLPRGVILLEQACKEAPPSGCAVLAELLLTGQAGKPDPKRAVELLERACEHELPEGCSALGMALLSGAGGVASNAERGAKLVREACELRESPIACGQLATLEAQGVAPIARDPARARTRAQRACDEGFPAACTLVGMLLLEPTGSAPDATAAAKALEQACRAGDGNGCAFLGAQLIEGRGVKQDPERGLALLGDACEKLGSMQGCSMRARALVLGGVGNPEERKSGAELAGSLCLQGEATSCIVAAAAYVEGRGVPRDLDRGARFLIFACAGAFEPACKLKARLPAPLVAKLERELAASQAAVAASASAAAAPPPAPRALTPSLSLLPPPGP